MSRAVLPVANFPRSCLVWPPAMAVVNLHAANGLFDLGSIHSTYCRAALDPAATGWPYGGCSWSRLTTAIQTCSARAPQCGGHRASNCYADRTAPPGGQGCQIVKPGCLYPGDCMRHSVLGAYQGMQYAQAITRNWPHVYIASRHHIAEPASETPSSGCYAVGGRHCAAPRRGKRHDEARPQGGRRRRQGSLSYLHLLTEFHRDCSAST